MRFQARRSMGADTRTSASHSPSKRWQRDWSPAGARLLLKGFEDRPGVCAVLVGRHGERGRQRFFHAWTMPLQVGWPPPAVLHLSAKRMSKKRTAEGGHPTVMLKLSHGGYARQSHPPSLRSFGKTSLVDREFRVTGRVFGPACLLVMTNAINLRGVRRFRGGAASRCRYRGGGTFRTGAGGR